MANERPTLLVPYHQADPETQAACHAGLQKLHYLDALPEAWTCGSCGKTTPGEEILINADLSDTPTPYCPNCWASGLELRPVTA